VEEVLAPLLEMVKPLEVAVLVVCAVQSQQLAVAVL
jgi:hypothetical protein